MIKKAYRNDFFQFFINNYLHHNVYILGRKEKSSQVNKSIIKAE